jgi:hypothetical protein
MVGGVTATGSRWDKTRVFALVSGAVLAVSGLYLVAHFDPAQPGWFPRCYLYVATGLYCPGCGITRSLHALLHGDLAAAISWNPLVVVLPLIGGVCLVRRRWMSQRWFGPVACSALILFTVLRNIPAWPFLLLAPH